jgi:chloride channel protein, CIC family
MEVGLDDVTDDDVPPRRSSSPFGVRSVGERLRGLGRRSRETLLLSAVVGVITGVGVAGFETAVTRGLDGVNRLPLWGIAIAPLIGLTVAALALRWIGSSSSPATADEYLHAFHDPDYPLPLRALAARMIAGVATLGSGAPMGLEGPSLYLGATLGDALQQRFPRLFSAGNRRLLLGAGAAAGVAAIFKAPATGAVFALEVPYQNDLARHMLGPALVGAASSYLAFVAIHGTAPLVNVAGSPPFSSKDLMAALALGLLAGLGARGFAWILRSAKNLSLTIPSWVRVPVAGASLAGIFVIARLLAGQNLTTGPGYDTIHWALDPSHSVVLVAAILALRCLATTTTVAGGGVGGLFIPLVVAGALVGRIVGGAINALDTSLFTVIGIAAFLGAGYRVPLAAVVFVAEATGRPGFVVPGVLAAVIAELIMSNDSVTVLQRAAPEDGVDLGHA